jgi:hypothetical protein
MTQNAGPVAGIVRALPATRLFGITAALAGAAMLAAVPAALRHIDGPPPAHTGGFGEPTCHVCHVDETLNSPGGAIELDALPDSVAASTAVRFSVIVRHAKLERAGFELAFRFASGPRAGQQAGHLRSVDDRTRVTAGPGEVQYAHHVRTSIDPVEKGVGRWTLEWIAPPDAGAVVLHVAANASPWNDSELGDWIYTLEKRVKIVRVDRASASRARSATFSAEKPSSRSATSPGADAPNRSRPTTSP